MAISPWTFDGADWENPNPCDYRYWDALREALQTRVEIITRDELGGTWYWLPSFQLPAMPAFTNHQGADNIHRLCLTVADALDKLAFYFADPTERDSWQGFPNLLGWIRDTYCQRSDGVVALSSLERLDCFSNRDGCHYRTLPPVGSPASAYGDWIKACRNALDMLTLYAPSYVPGIVLEANVDWNDQIPGKDTLAEARAANDTNLRRYLRVLRSGTPETYTWPWDGNIYDTSNTHRVPSGSWYQSRSVRNPGTVTSYTTSTWRGYTSGTETVDAFSECTTSEELRLDFAANLWPKDYAIDIQMEDLANNMRRTTVNRAEYEPPAYPDRGGVPLYYPHRDIDGEVLLLLHAGRDLWLHGGPGLPEPATFESPHPEGFQVHRLGKLSEHPTFTIGDADAIPASTPVSVSKREGTRGAAYRFWVLVDYAPKG